MKYINLLWNLYQLKRNTKKTRKQIEQLRQEKLRKMLCYAFDNSKYYHNAFRNAGISREQLLEIPISRLPKIDKKILLENFDDIVTVPDLTQQELRKFDEQASIEQKTFNGKYHVVHSSGSTGVPGYFVYDEMAWSQMLLGIIRAALWNMSMPQILKLLVGGPRIIYIAATDGRYGGAMAVGAGIEGVKASQLFLDIKMPIAEWIKKIKEFKPNMAIGYPSAIKILAELVQSGQVELDVFRIVSCGEPLGHSIRKHIEKLFNADVVNLYGASESLAIGVETDVKEGMYLFDDMNYIEIEGENMYLTSLYNFAQPLIRYKISDRLKLKQADNSDRYPFTKIESLLGRNEDMLWFDCKGGGKDFLHPLAVEGFCIDGLLDYQFCQIDSTAFEMLAEIANEENKASICAKMMEQMNKILKEKHLEHVRFYVRFVNEILPNPKTGKKPLIVCPEEMPERREAV